MGDIWQAARANNIKRTKVLLDQGVSPNITRWSGVAPLHRAAEVNSCQVAQILINAGCSVNAKTAWGWFTPLHFAVQNGHEQVSEVLLRAGAKWTVFSKRLQTPYDLAVARGLKLKALRIQDELESNPCTTPAKMPDALGVPSQCMAPPKSASTIKNVSTKQISRKAAENRRLLQQSAPKDADTAMVKRQSLRTMTKKGRETSRERPQQDKKDR